MLTAVEVEGLVAHVEYKDWKFLVGPLDEGWYVQVAFVDVDHDTGNQALIKGRKFYISPHAVPDEVVKTCWLAVEIAIRHEAMESFKFSGVALFHPHNDCFAMAGLPKVHRQDIVLESPVGAA